MDLAPFLDALLADRLDSDRFEHVVAEAWAADRYAFEGPPGLAGRLRAWAARAASSGYGAATDRVRFACRLLFGGPGRPGGFLISGPGEVDPAGGIGGRNRPPHAHASGRVAVVVRGGAAFFVHRRESGRDVTVEVPLRPGVVLLWPPGALHTFDAGARGLDVFCAMGAYLAPDREHFPVAPPGGWRDLDALPRVRREPLAASLASATPPGAGSGDA